MNKVLCLMMLQAAVMPVQTMRMVKSLSMSPMSSVLSAQSLRYRPCFNRPLSSTSSSQQQKEHTNSKHTFSKIRWLGAGLLGGYLYAHRDYYREQIYDAPRISLVHGILTGEVRFVKAACDLGVNVRKVTIQGTPLLEYAVRQAVDLGHDVAIVQTLIDHGADVFVPTQKTVSLLHEAVSRDRYYDLHIAQLVDILVAAGLTSAINERDPQSEKTPLMLAVAKEHTVNVFKALLRAKPDLALQDSQGQTVEDLLHMKKDACKNIFEEPFYQQLVSLPEPKGTANRDQFHKDFEREIAQWDEKLALIEIYKKEQSPEIDVKALQK